MANRILIAAPGRTVLQEDGRSWPAEGMEDPNTLFTRRRIADLDLVDAPDDVPADVTIGEEKPAKPKGKADKTNDTETAGADTPAETTGE